MRDERADEGGGDVRVGTSAAVAVCIVTHEAAAEIEECLASLRRLESPPAEVVVVDCASSDRTVERAHRAGETLAAATRFRLLPLAENRGFAGGINAALAASSSPWVLSLNADARPAPDFLHRLLAPTAARARVAAVAGRLYRMPVPQQDEEDERRLDACGMRLTLSWRHLDRGSGEVERGQYTRPALVFGATGAASLFRRAALDDVAIGGEVFDEDFHSFREDAELCFRLHERGWEVLYEPTAVAWHRRYNLPQRRASMPPAVNYHGLKNRYLLRAYHQTLGNALLTAPAVLWREGSILAYVLLRERTSLAAYGWLWRNRRRIRERRRTIQTRRTAPPRAIDSWFLRHELPP